MLEGVLKRYPEIGDHPNKVLSNPSRGSIEPLQIEPQKVLSNPLLAPEKVLLNPSERVFRTTEKVLSNLSHRTPGPHHRVWPQIGLDKGGKAPKGQMVLCSRGQSPPFSKTLPSCGTFPPLSKLQTFTLQRSPPLLPHPPSEKSPSKR